MSPSTRQYDRVAKFQHYCQIHSIEEYILIEQDSYSIERLRRSPGSQWEITSFQGEAAVLKIDSVNLTIPLRDIYADVPFELAERDTARPERLPG